MLYTVVGTGSTGTVNELVALIITHLSDSKRIRYFMIQGRPAGRGGGGSGIPVYPKKIPKIHPNIPKIIPTYTLHLKFKESDIPNTRI